jgi:hypothetical protein
VNISFINTNNTFDLEKVTFTNITMIEDNMYELLHKTGKYSGIKSIRTNDTYKNSTVFEPYIDSRYMINHPEYKISDEDTTAINNVLIANEKIMKALIEMKLGSIALSDPIDYSFASNYFRIVLQEFRKASSSFNSPLYDRFALLIGNQTTNYESYIEAEDY